MKDEEEVGVKMKTRGVEMRRGACTGGERRGGFSFLGISYSLKFAEENCFREENPSRGASVTFP